MKNTNGKVMRTRRREIEEISENTEREEEEITKVE